jgi:uncharacterized protein YegP (UPF0339 family)
MVYFQINKNKNSYTQPYWWVIKSSGNHQTLATSEMYARKQEAISAINLVKVGAGAATIYDNTGEV